MKIDDLGWNSYFESQFAEYGKRGLFPGRISQEHKSVYRVVSEKGILTAELSGRLRFNSLSRNGYPAVGDWVAIAVIEDEEKAIIHAILPRRNTFKRKVAGLNTEEQILAANIDTVFIVCGLDGDFNLRRIERYMTLAWESGAMPVVILNKSDLCDDTDIRIGELESVAIGVPIEIVSAKVKTGLEAFRKFIIPGSTSAFMGSSGAGKSSLINCLLGEEMLNVGEVRESDSRGRHTTTYRQLILLPNGGLVIDTPGIRELQLWGDDQGLGQAFEDIEKIAAGCRFRDCNHEKEPGCAVREAIVNGTLDSRRYESFLKLKKEQQYLEIRQMMKANALEKLRWKKVSEYQKYLKRSRQ